MSDASMYAAVMGDAFSRLDPPVRQFHSFAGRHEFLGQVQIAGPSTLAAKLLALLLGAPMRDVHGPFRFELSAGAAEETWTRFFPNQTMQSTLSKAESRIKERLGAARLTFALRDVNGALEMQLEQLTFLGIPCPAWLMPHVIARETGEGDKFHFHIHASVPLIGRVASYTGHLCMPGKELP